MKTFVRYATIALCLLAARLLAAEEITVFAAASLTEALTEIGKDYEKSTGDKMRFNFAASNMLARQIEAGAPADVFFSADETQMDGLAAKGLIVKDSRKAVLGNTLVIVTAPDGPSIAKEEDLAREFIRRIMLGDPKAVPVGVYAKQHLEALGLWTTLQPKIIPAESVRAALAGVESGNAEAGIVYKTDAAISKKVKIALEIPASKGPVIRYPVALVAGCGHAEAAKKFLASLYRNEAREVFLRRGFTLLTSKE